MARKSRENPEIRAFILREITAHPRDIAAVAARKFGVTRTSANRYLRKLVDAGLLSAEGATKARAYALREIVDVVFDFAVDAKAEEDAIWRARFVPLMDGVPKNVVDICQYGATEMINNVIDHSGAAKGMVWVKRNVRRIEIGIRDHGVGIFEKIRTVCNLSDPREALLELSKGKLTTDPSRHSGEGIFFTSRMFETFSILSSDLYYQRTMQDDDEWLVETQTREQAIRGTLVVMTMDTGATYTDRDVFKKYEGDDGGFSRTHVPVRLARYDDEQLVSRSQARRVLSRFEKFSEVLLDFKGVPKIGQAFADEIFRVFKNEHPEIGIIAINTSDDVADMIDHVRSAEKSARDPSSPPTA